MSSFLFDWLSHLDPTDVVWRRVWGKKKEDDEGVKPDEALLLIDTLMFIGVTGCCWVADGSVVQWVAHTSTGLTVIGVLAGVLVTLFGAMRARDSELIALVWLAVFLAGAGFTGGVVFDSFGASFADGLGAAASAWFSALIVDFTLPRLGVTHPVRRALVGCAIPLVVSVFKLPSPDTGAGAASWLLVIWLLGWHVHTRLRAPEIEYVRSVPYVVIASFLDWVNLARATHLLIEGVLGVASHRRNK